MVKVPEYVLDTPKESTAVIVYVCVPAASVVLAEYLDRKSVV